MRQAKLAVLVPLLLLLGCSDPYGASAKAASTIAAAVGSGLTTVQSLQASGEISTQEALNVAGYLKFVSDADGAYETCIGTAHTSKLAGAFTTCAATFNSALNTPSELALVHVSNTTASQTISTIVTGFTTAIALVTSSLGGA